VLCSNCSQRWRRVGRAFCPSAPFAVAVAFVVLLSTSRALRGIGERPGVSCRQPFPPPSEGGRRLFAVPPRRIEYVRHSPHFIPIFS